MIISVNWLKKFTEIDLPINDLVDLIGSRLVEVEKYTDLGLKYKGVVVAKVVEASSLEGSDHLTLVKLDDGRVVDEIARDESGFVQVVCGAPNVHVGQMVAWVTPGSTVPQTYGSDKPLEMVVKDLRGVTSNGMIASARELDLFDEHEGILVLDDNLAPGVKFAETYELNDYLLDIENKSLTNRPDTFGVIGFAREIAAIQGNKFITPQILLNEIFESDKSDKELRVTIDDSKLCSRYQAVVMSGAEDKKSPLIIQTYLARVGMRPINAVVDVTNYLMLLTGQPLHAFDYDKLVQVGDGKADIHVRTGRGGEKLELLDGKTVELATEDIVIASGETAIGLAGAMGGANTEIDSDTRNIIIESATFNMYNLRGTQMRHGIFGEAITRFTKGQPAKLTMPVICNAVKLMREWSGAVPVSEIVESYPARQKENSVILTTDSVNNILGTQYDTKVIVDTLLNAEFDISEKSDGLTVKVPWWRADVHEVEDLIEEVGRLNGFENIEPSLPSRSFLAIKPSDFDDFKERIRQILVRAGANEVLTYSFVHGDLITKSGQNPDDSYKIVNSLSPSLQFYRQTLTPSLVDIVHPNIKQGYEKFALFELNKTHMKSLGTTDEMVPVENYSLALVVASSAKTPGSPYYQAKKILDYLLNELGVDARYSDISAANSLSAPFESKRSAEIVSESGVQIGVVGEYGRIIRKNFKLPEYSAGFEINLSMLFEVAKGAVSYQQISRYPFSERDICFKVASEIKFAEIIDNVKLELDSGSEEYGITPVDIYKAEGGRDKNITIRIRLTSHDHTLNGQEVSEIIDRVANAVAAKTDATVV